MSGGTALIKQIVMDVIANPNDSKEQLASLTDQAEKLRDPIRLTITGETAQAQEQADAVTEALQRYTEAAAEADDASARLAEIDREAAGGEDEYAAALERASEATLAALDAQIRLGEAELEAAGRSREGADAQEESAAKTDESAAAAEGLGSKLKLAALGFAAAGAIGVKMAGNMDQATNRLVTSAGESAKNLSMVRSGLLSLSVSTATSMSQLEQGMYMVESAGFHGAAGLNVLKASAQGAYEEGASVGTMANAVTSALNAYSLSGSHATMITNQMLAAVGQGKMTLQDLAGSLSAVLPVAAAAHLSFAQVGGGMATMTAQGTSAFEAAQLLRHTIVALQNPSSVQTAEMQQLGVSSNALAKNIGKAGLTGTIQELEEAILHSMGPGGLVLLKAFNQSKLAAQSAQDMINAMPPSLANLARAYLDGSISVQQWNAIMFKGSLPAEQKALLEQFASVANSAHGFNSMLKAGQGDAQTFTAALSKVMGGAEGLQVALQVGGAHAATFNHNVAVVGAAAKNAGANIEGWSLTQNQFNFELASAKNAAEAAATSFGQALMPAVLAVLHPIVGLMGWIAKTSGASEALAIVLGGVLSVVLATKLASGLKTATGMVEGLWGGFGKLAQMLPGVGAAAGEAAAETEALAAAQEGQAVAAEGAAAAQEGLDVAMDANPIGALIMALAMLGVGIAMIVTHWHDFEHWGAEAFDTVEHAAEDVWGWIKTHWPLLLAILLGPVGIAADFIIGHWHDIEAGAEDAFHGVESAVDGAIGWVKGHWPLLMAIMTGGTSLAAQWIIGHWHDIESGAADAIDGVEGFFRALPGRVASFLAGLPGMLWSVGWHAIDALINGASSLVSWAESTVAGWGHDIANALGSAFGIHFSEPSEAVIMRRAGRQAGMGLAAGMLDTEALVAAAAHRLSASAGINAGHTTGGYGASAVPAAGRGQGNINLYISFPALLAGSPDAIWRYIQQGLSQLKRHNGNIELGLS